jgi:tetratricopeptide (TPR) repeat protein
MNEQRLKQLQELLNSEPNDCFLLHAMGVEYFSADNFESAVEYFRNALQVDKNYLASYYQLGQALEKIGDNIEAIKVYREGVEVAKKQNNNKALGELNQALWMLED